MGSTESRGDITLAFYTVLVDSRSLSNVTRVIGWEDDVVGIMWVVSHNEL